MTNESLNACPHGLIYEGQCKLCPPPHGTASEISDDKAVQANWLSKIRMELHYPECWDTVAYPTIFDALFEIAGCSECRPPKPVLSVSLEKCAIAMAQGNIDGMPAQIAENFDWPYGFSDHNKANFRQLAKAVLDAAGVKYVD